MRAREILDLQRRRPFSGLRIYMSDGESYEIHHPEQMSVTTTIIHLALPRLADSVPTWSVYCAPVHVTRVEPLNGDDGSSV
jgi:hypothetical protein